MCCDRHNDDGSRGISPKDIHIYCGDDSKEGRQWVMGMGLGGCGIGDHENLDNMGVREDEAGKKI